MQRTRIGVVAVSLVLLSVFVINPSNFSEREAQSDIVVTQDISVIAWSPTEDRFLTGGKAGEIILWEFVDNRSQMLRVYDLPLVNVSTDQVTEIIWHPNGKLFAVSRVVSGITIHLAGSEKIIKTLNPEMENISYTIHWSPGGESLIVLSALGIYYYETIAFALEDQFHLEGDVSRSIQWISDDYFILASDSNRTSTYGTWWKMNTDWDIQVIEPVAYYSKLFSFQVDIRSGLGLMYYSVFNSAVSKLVLWNLSTGEIFNQRQYSDIHPTKISISPGGAAIAEVIEQNNQMDKIVFRYTKNSFGESVTIPATDGQSILAWSYTEPVISFPAGEAISRAMIFNYLDGVLLESLEPVYISNFADTIKDLKPSIQNLDLVFALLILNSAMFLIDSKKELFSVAKKMSDPTYPKHDPKEGQSNTAVEDLKSQN